MADIEIKCPQCGNITTVSEFAELEYINCKSCNSQIPVDKDANQESEKPKLRLKKDKKQYDNVDDEKNVDPYFQPPKPGKAKSDFSIAQHIIAWIIFIALGTLMYFIRYKGFLLDSRQLDIMKTYAPLVFLGFNILIILKAFSDNILQGILTLLIPGYSIIYLLFISDDFYARAVFAGLMVGMGEDAWLAIHDYALGIYTIITNWLSWD